MSFMVWKRHLDTAEFHLTGYVDTSTVDVTGNIEEAVTRLGSEEAKGGTHATDVRPGAHAAPYARDLCAGRSSQEAGPAPPPLAEAVVSARRWAAAARHRLGRARREPLRRRRYERNPDDRPAMDTLDDWILFGPRMR